MLKNILGLRERRVGDVMVPRADIIAVQQDIKLGELVRVFEGAAHSRLVVYNDTLDDPVGMVHIRDLIAFMTARAAVDPEKNAKRKKPLPAGLDLKAINLAMPLSAAKIVREILFVPPSMRVIDLLARMQATRIHLSLVVDEYGGTDGLASIEDIVEQIVGEIADEHDEDETPAVAQQPDGSFVADARAKIEDVVGDRRQRFRRRRRGRGGRYDRRLSGDARRPLAGARRDRPRTGPVRIRSARRRSAPRQARAHYPAEGAARPAARGTQARRRRWHARRRHAVVLGGRRCVHPKDAGPAARRAPAVTLTRLAHAVMLAFGWRRAIIAFVAGAASALAMAPINAWPILFVTFPVLVWLVDGSAAGRWSGPMTAAVAGWCFGFGYFLAGLYWIGYAFLVDAKTFGWLLPVAVAGFPPISRFTRRLGLAAARLIWVRGPERVLALAATLTAAEWLRGHLLSGFPWNTFGYALTEPLVLAQSVSLVGIWTLTFLCVAICASPAVLADDKADTPHPYRPLVHRHSGPGGVRRLWRDKAMVASDRAM